jgi:ABC-type transport system involved in cytochrome bd biosynthesis fused ATPase/permease subunit
LILDEPTNHLDNDTVKELLENIQNLTEKPSILLITHIDEVAHQADSIYVLNRKGTMSARKNPAIHLPDQESLASYNHGQNLS